MYLPKFELLSFSFLPSERKKIILRSMLEALICTDWQFLEWYKDQFGKRFPSLYDYAPRYILKVRPGGLDSWQDIPDTIALQSGDCKDFACWRIAELRSLGIDDVYPVIVEQTYPDPKGIEGPMTVYHIQVRVGGDIEDPSAILGMPTQVSYDQLRGDVPAVSGYYGPITGAPRLYAVPHFRQTFIQPGYVYRQAA